MKSFQLILALFFGLVSCNKNNDKPGIKSNQAEEMIEQQNQQLNHIKLDFSNPVSIDSSDYVIFPLELGNNTRVSYESSSYGQSTKYWNLVFYNTRNGAYHLLNDTLKMMIHSYNTKCINAISSSSCTIDYPENTNRIDQMLYYLVTIDDYNKDGKLDSDDPAYLFTSDRTGKQFKQISPDFVNVTYWETLSGTNKVVMMATNDTNGDLLFNQNDETTPFVYVLNENRLANEVLSSDFKTKLKKQLDHFWSK